MSVYFDANVLVALFISDPLSTRAVNYLRAAKPAPILTDLAAAEFASAVSRRVRMGEIGRDDAVSAFAKFDAWVMRMATRLEMEAADVRAAEAMLRRLDSSLRAPDAFHIAIAQRIGAELATFDTRMAENAKALGVSLAPL